MLRRLLSPHVNFLRFGLYCFSTAKCGLLTNAIRIPSLLLECSVAGKADQSSFSASFFIYMLNFHCCVKGQNWTHSRPMADIAGADGVGHRTSAGREDSWYRKGPAWPLTLVHLATEVRPHSEASAFWNVWCDGRWHLGTRTLRGRIEIDVRGLEAPILKVFQFGG